MDSYDEWLADESDLTYREWCEARTMPCGFTIGQGGMTALQALTATGYTFSTVPLLPNITSIGVGTLTVNGDTTLGSYIRR